MVSPWRAAPRGGSCSCTLRAATCWHHDAIGRTLVCCGFVAGLWALVLQRDDFKDGAPQGQTAEESRAAARAMWANCCPRVLSGLTKTH